MFDFLQKFVPSFLNGESKFAAWVVDLLWVDCPYCFGMRFAFLSSSLTFALTASGFYFLT